MDQKVLILDCIESLLILDCTPESGVFHDLSKLKTRSAVLISDFHTVVWGGLLQAG